MVKKTKIRNHASVIIIPECQTERFLFSVYDSTYPYEQYRGFSNLMGGNLSINDAIPFDILRREVNEELIDSNIANAILKGALPWRDFIQGNYKGPNDKGIISVYQTLLFSREVMDYLEEAIIDKKRLVTEGELGVVTLTDLIRGNAKTAWGVPVILGEYLRTKLINPQGVTAICIGKPRETIRDYTEEFDYGELELI